MSMESLLQYKPIDNKELWLLFENTVRYFKLHIVNMRLKPKWPFNVYVNIMLVTVISILF